MKRFFPVLLILLTFSLFSGEPQKLLLFNFEHPFFSFSEGTGDRGGKGSFSIVSKPSFNGKPVGKFSYDFSGTGEEIGYVYAPINCAIPLPGKPIALVIPIYGDGSQHTFAYRFVDKTGEVFQGGIGAITWKGWKEVTLPLTEQSTFSWGGNQDHKIDYPIHLSQLIIDKNSNSLPLKGEIYLGDFYVQTEDVKPEELFLVDVKADKPQMIYKSGESAVVSLIALNRSEEKRNVSLTVEARDFFKTPILAKDVNLSVPPQSVQSSSLKIPLNKLGSYIVDVKEKGGSWQKQIVLSVLPPFRKGKLDISSPFGINGHIPNERELSMMERAGIRWCRMDFLWEINEPEKEKFNWKIFDEVFANAKKHAVYPLPILCYNSPWGSKKSENGKGTVPDLNNWIPNVKESVRKYKDFVKFWEVWNEPNIGFWTGTLDEYAELLRATYKAIKEEDKEAKVAMGGTAGTDLRYIEELYKRNVPFDIVNIHPYGYPTAPEKYLENQINACRELMRKYGDEKKPIWITEYGWPNHIAPNGVDILTQANYIVRAFVIALGAGVEKIFWYDYQNGPDPYYNEHNFGIVYMGDIPKPCYVSLSTMTRLLEGKNFLKKLDMPEDCYAYFFQSKNKEETIVMWAMEDKEVVLDWKGKGRLVDLMGNEKPISSDGLLKLKLSPSPIFLVCKGDNLPSVAFRWEKSAIELMPMEPASDNLIIRTSSPLKISISFTTPKGVEISPSSWSANLKKGEWKKSFSFLVKTIPLGNYEVVAHIKVGKQTFKLSKKLSVISPYKVWLIPSPIEQSLKIKVRNLYKKKKAEGLVASLQTPSAILKYLSAYFPIMKPGEESIQSIPLFLDLSEVPTAFNISVSLKDKNGVTINYQRKVSFFTIEKAEGNPLDPSNPQWENITGILLDKKDFYQKINDDWKGQNDLWVEGKFLWDDDNFYLKITVIDDVFFNNYSPEDIWQGDSVQFAIAPKGEHMKDEPFVQIDIGRSNGKDIVFRRAFGMNLKEGEIEAKGTIVAEGNKTIYLLAIPWKELGIKPASGLSFGFSFLVNDNDGAGRKGWMEWGGGIGWEKNPADFYDLTLR